MPLRRAGKTRARAPRTATRRPVRRSLQAEGRTHPIPERLRIHRLRYAAGARYSHRQRVGRVDSPDGADSSRLLRDRRHRRFARPTAGSRSRPNPSLKMLGVVITLFDKRTNISRDTHEQIRSVFGDASFQTRISRKADCSPRRKSRLQRNRSSNLRRSPRAPKTQKTCSGGRATCRSGSTNPLFKMRHDVALR